MKKLPFIVLLFLAFPSASAQDCGGQWIFIQDRQPLGNREKPGLVYDDTAGHVVLFGGASAVQAPGGTFAWDGSTWTRFQNSNDPTTRLEHAMASRPGPTNQKILLYGGRTFNQFRTETYTFDGSAWTLQASIGGPPGIYGGALAFHQGIGKYIHFGGISSSGLYSDSTFEWDGTQWLPINIPGPTARAFHAMEYDPIRNEIVLFGGRGTGGAGYLGDTWVFDGASWTLKNVINQPLNAAHAGMAFDPSRGTMVMHGGSTNVWPFPANNQRNQTWEWNGAGWTAVNESNPLARTYMAMVYDAANSELFLYGTTDSQHYRYRWDQGPPTINPVGGSATADYPTCPLNLGVIATSGTPPTYQWYKDGVPMVNAARISGVATPNLSIHPTRASDAGLYFCRVTNTCGTTDSTSIVVNAQCQADVNMNGAAEPSDFTAWITAFNNNDSAADQNCDGSITSTDFTRWLANFQIGC